MKVWVDGVATRFVPADDRGLHYGDGVFTTALVWQGKIIWPAAHLRRLQQDAAAIHIRPPPSQRLLAEWGTATQGIKDGVLKAVITRGSSQRGYAMPPLNDSRHILYLSDLPAHPVSHWQQGIRLRTAQLRLASAGSLTGIKHLNRLEQVLLRRELDPFKADENLVCDSHGVVVGGGMSNVFWVRQGQLFTPALDQAGIAGVARSQLLDAANTLGISTRIGRYTPDSIQHADEIFMTNAVIGLWPVKRWGESVWAVGPVTRKLANVIGHPLTLQVCRD